MQRDDLAMVQDMINRAVKSESFDSKPLENKIKELEKLVKELEVIVKKLESEKDKQITGRGPNRVSPKEKNYGKL